MWCTVSITTDRKLPLSHDSRLRGECSTQVWAIISAQFCQSVGMYGLLNWLPSYLHDARGLGADSAELGALAAAPYAIQVKYPSAICYHERLPRLSRTYPRRYRTR